MWTNPPLTNKPAYAIGQRVSASSREDIDDLKTTAIHVQRGVEVVNDREAVGFRDGDASRRKFRDRDLRGDLITPDPQSANIISERVLEGELGELLSRVEHSSKPLNPQRFMAHELQVGSPHRGRRLLEARERGVVGRRC